MENKSMTAVEWLYNNLKSHFEHNGDLLEVVNISFNQAKEMERLQSIDDFTCGSFEGYKGANGFPSMLVNDYINKKYQK